MTKESKLSSLPTTSHAQAQDNRLAEVDLEQVPIACEYPDVFPDELPGMPPIRDIEFIIELMPGAGPICKNP